MPSTTGTTKGPQSSGIETSASGDRHIPESVRADGSIRREIKIRPGYRPQEDVAVYKNRTAEAWKNRGTGPVPGYEGLKAAKKEAAEGKDGEGQADGSANNRNAKRREARKKAKVASAAGEESAEGADGADKADTSTGPATATTTTPQQAETAAVVDPEAEKEKQARTLKKKLRQARDLKEKKDSGESLLPEQLAKVIKIQELIRQLDSLGFDVDGEKKS